MPTPGPWIGPTARARGRQGLRAPERHAGRPDDRAGAGRPQRRPRAQDAGALSPSRIAIETSEEERLEKLLRAVAADVPLSILEWSVTRGLRAPGAEQPVYGTAEPIQALAAMGELTAESLFVLHDFAPHLAAPQASRAFRDLLERFSAPGRLSTRSRPRAARPTPASAAASSAPS
jgi:hypothetical protein